MPTRYALIGTGSRAQMYLEAVRGAHSPHAALVAWGDSNPGRLDWNRQRHFASGPAPEVLDLADLASEIRRLRIERMIVTAPDSAHADIVAESLAGGSDAVVEKPLTTDESGVRRIADAVARSGRSVQVTFNYRYAPRNAALKEVIASGRIGEVTSVHFEWLLDTAHGADYFRRWHREKQNSGGLLVHKSSHHFDLVNWWLDDIPVRAYARGGLKFYGARNAAARGLEDRPARGTTDDAPRDPFRLDLREHDVLRGLYYDQEQFDGYLRDRDVFADGITIEDNLALVADYRSGAVLTYSLNAHAPWEGYTVAVNGTKGRAELSVVERGAVLVEDDGSPKVVDPSATPGDTARETGRPVGDALVVQTHFGPAEAVTIPPGDGGHGGADTALLREVFVGGADDPLGRAASWIDGVRAASVGIAGNISLATGAPVDLATLDLGGALVAFR